jgi:hypothetical protein
MNYADLRRFLGVKSLYALALAAVFQIVDIPPYSLYAQTL